MKTSRIELSFEQHEVWRVSQADEIEPRQCPYCSEVSPMIAAENLARVMCESPRNIYKLIDQGDLHYEETDQMQVYVCLRSYSKTGEVKNEKDILV
jgi:hypothetical protein